MRFTSIVSGIVLMIVLMGLCGCNRETANSASISDEQLAQLLVKLELRTRGVIAGHYVKADTAHREWLAENLLLPAAVADGIFYEIVPETTGGRAWVKMVVDEPRNPHNKGDETAVVILDEIKAGTSPVTRRTADAYYYAEPIVAKKTCLQCHGQPKGDPDPFFPQYKKDGWEEGEIIGAVVGRVSQPM